MFEEFEKIASCATGANVVRTSNDDWEQFEGTSTVQKILGGLGNMDDNMPAFWQEALHYVPREMATDRWVVLCDPKGKGPNVSLDQVPDRRSGKTNRLHLDLYTIDQEDEVERLIKPGARRYRWKYQPDG